MNPNRFFVYIVESPSPDNIYKGIFEGKSLSETLALSGIKSEYKLVVDKATFINSLQDGLVEAIGNHKIKPILHISAHGDSNGIKLTDGTFLTWKELRTHLIPINQGLNGFFLCLSSCHGYSGARMSMVLEDNDLPFSAIIANSQDVAWADTNIAYSSFYHLFAKGYEVKDAVENMRRASGNNYFLYELAERAREGYRKFVEDVKIRQMQKTI